MLGLDMLINFMLVKNETCTPKQYYCRALWTSEQIDLYTASCSSRVGRWRCFL